MTTVANRPTRLGDLLKAEFWRSHTYERQEKNLTVAEYSETSPHGVEIGQVYTNDGTLMVAADVGWKVTPTVANSTEYTLTVIVDGVAKTFDFTSDADATATEIVDGFVTAINADSDINGKVTASNVSDVLVVAPDSVVDLQVTSQDSNLDVVDALKDIVILIDDEVYTDGHADASSADYAVLTGGPGASGGAVVVREQLKFGDSLDTAEVDAVVAQLNEQGIQVATQL